jgi:hypothetical protein
LENCHDQANDDHARSLREADQAPAEPTQGDRVRGLERDMPPWDQAIDLIEILDRELKEAIEAFRQGLLAQTDAQLAEFGIEPPAPKSEEQKPN